MVAGTVVHAALEAELVKVDYQLLCICDDVAYHATNLISVQSMQMPHVRQLLHSKSSHTLWYVTGSSG